LFVDYPKNAAQSGPLKPISPLCSLGKYKQKEKKGVLRVTSPLELGFKSRICYSWLSYSIFIIALTSKNDRIVVV